ncbi:MAG: hypothetical protein ACO1SX_27165 [Actinomycetota bacterium]
MNFDRGLLKKLATLLDVDPETLTREEAQKLVRAKMERKVNGIAKRMVKDGHTVAQAGAEKAIRSALFRLWRDAVLTFRGGGELSDIIRDSQDDKIIGAMTEANSLVDGSVSPEELVTLVMDATLYLTF